MNGDYKNNKEKYLKALILIALNKTRKPSKLRQIAAKALNWNTKGGWK